MSNHALVFGASGISGWALVKEALSYPNPTAFSKVTALTNRPLSFSDSQWPEDNRLQLISGIDLTRPVANVVQLLKDIPSIETVSHVFLFLYLDPGKDKKALIKVNTDVIRTAVEATQQVSLVIKSFILQTGGKSYGLGKQYLRALYAPLTSQNVPVSSGLYLRSKSRIQECQNRFLTTFSTTINMTCLKHYPTALHGLSPRSDRMQ